MTTNLQLTCLHIDLKKKGRGRLTDDLPCLLASSNPVQFTTQTHTEKLNFYINNILGFICSTIK